MPLGLAKDSMLNLADLVHKQEDEDNNEKRRGGGGGDDGVDDDNNTNEKMMRLSTGEIIKDENNPSSLILPEVVVNPAAAAAPDAGEDEDEDSMSAQELSPSSSLLDATSATSPPPQQEQQQQQPPQTMNTSRSNGSMASSTYTAPSTTADSEADRVTSNHSRQYAGFSMDYREYDHYTDPSAYTAYASSSGALVPNLGQKNHNKGFWCCLFPWMDEDDDDDKYNKTSIYGDGSAGAGVGAESQESLVNLSEQRASAPSPKTVSRSGDDDDVSTGSDVFGEKLSDKDRQAVLARLRLAQPDTAPAAASGPDTSNHANPTMNGNETEDGTSKKSKEKGLLNGISVPSTSSMGQVDGKNKPRGILRRTSVVGVGGGIDPVRSSQSLYSSGEATSNRRRSLFPSYEPKIKQKKNLKATFSPMARVMSIKSHKDMNSIEKGDVWWQKSDYEEFKKTGRMITKAMLEGGSEIWLAANQSWQLPNQGRAGTLKHAYSLAERHKAFMNGDINAKKEYEDTRDKWWHKFGHSRRGLEHIASIDEGRQRQQNVKNAIKAVIDEQRRHKAYRREDSEKLRMISIQHTSWARDLALAAGASDADAVRANFDDESRKSREFYLLKFSRADQLSRLGNNNNNKRNVGSNGNTSSGMVGTSKQASRTVPAFMKPALNVTPSRLDANTMSQVRFRHSQARRPTRASSTRLATTTTTTTTKKTVADAIPIRDMPTGTSMAKKAAGFASGEEVANMSAVLTGMGAIPKKTATVGGP